MLTSVKSKLDETKTFVKKHQTLTACAATAVVTAYVSRKNNIRVTRDLFYAFGDLHMEVQTFATDVVSFLDHKGQWQEFLDYAPRLIRDN